MSFRTLVSSPAVTPPGTADEAASAYTAAGARYARYADGETGGLFDFTGRYGFADRQIWLQLDGVLMAMAARGRRDIRILDAGCGPGTWLCRIVERAAQLGFTSITASGFDLSASMVGLARQATAAAAASLAPDRVRLAIEVGDIRDPRPEADASVDLCVCLYGVLNHLPRDAMPSIASELSRITAGQLFVTARAVGSLPTLYVDGLETARRFQQDNHADRLDIDLLDGRHLSFQSHLFQSADLQALFAPYLPVIDLSGLDMFHSRFAPDPRWNPQELATEPAFNRHLAHLEQLYASDPDFIDHAAHIMLRGAR